MDIADQSQRHDELLHRANLKASRRDPANIVANGECHYFEEPLPPGLRWCGKECRDDWEKLNACPG